MLVSGNSGSGKSGAATLISRQKLHDPLTGLISIDPDGENSPQSAEYLANPENGLQWRKVHYLKPASQTHTFALPLLHVPDRSPQLCHDKAVRALSIFEQAVTVGAGEYGPRLSKFFYLGALGLALAGRPLCDLPDVYSNAAQLRRQLAAAYPYPFLRDAMLAVDELSPRAVLEYKDPLISRLLPIFGNERLHRVLGPQPPLNIASVLRNREVVLLDLSGLEHKDAVLVGKAFISLLYHEALQREPNREPHTCLLLDEAFDYISPDLARGFDRLRKRNVQICIVIQRFAQVRNPNDPNAPLIFSAVLSGTSTKICFRLPEEDDADLMTNVLFRGFVDLEEWKQGSARPTAVGNKLETVRSRSIAHHEAEHHARSRTTSHSHGTSRGKTSSSSTSAGEFSAAGDSAGLVMNPPYQILGPNAPDASILQYPVSQSTGESSSHGSSEMSSSAVAESEADIDMYGEAETEGIGTSRGTSVTEGESETFVTDYALLPTTMFSLQEQLHRLAGELQNLAHRECFVKVGNQKPVRTRTCDLAPAFKSHYARRIFLPLFHKRVIARSGYLFPVAEVDAQIAKRNQALQPIRKAEPDFTKPEPMLSNLMDDPTAFARDFLKRRIDRGRKPTKPDQPQPKSKPPGRRPRGGESLGPQHDKFRIIDGDGDKPKK
ncbi:MAG: hypothetical protein AB7G08_31790 [Hyphomicrobiaceae bacterium]